MAQRTSNWNGNEVPLSPTLWLHKNFKNKSLKLDHSFWCKNQSKKMLREEDDLTLRTLHSCLPSPKQPCIGGIEFPLISLVSKGCLTTSSSTAPGGRTGGYLGELILFELQFTISAFNKTLTPLQSLWSFGNLLGQEKILISRLHQILWSTLKHIILQAQQWIYMPTSLINIY